jgi:hypothetical protein
MATPPGKRAKTALESLDLSGLADGDALARLLLAHKDTLRVLKLRQCCLLPSAAEALGRLSRLVHLDLADNSLDEAGIRALVPALYRLSRGGALTTVDLRGNDAAASLQLCQELLPVPRLLA